MQHKSGTALFLALFLLSACDGKEESALDNLTNGASAAQVENNVRAEAQAVMEPLAPPAPGTPGGLPVDPEPISEGPIEPGSAQGAGQVVQRYYGLLEQKLFGDAQRLWREGSAVRAEEDGRFAGRFRAFSEVHANIGAPGEPEGAAGSLFVTVPVQVYGRLAASGKPWYLLRQVVLRRVNDVPGSDETARQWHIESIGSYAAPVIIDEEDARPRGAISMTDGMARKR
ncbi:MAG: hypothetical protein ABW164_09390 [Sphingobium sp.]